MSQNELDWVKSNVANYLKELGYELVDKKPTQLKLGEFCINKCDHEATHTRPDIIGCGPSGLFILEAKLDPCDGREAWNQVQEYCNHIASQVPVGSIYTYGIVLPLSDSMPEFILYKYGEEANEENKCNLEAMCNQVITDSIAFLRNMRQRFWRGQSYYHMYEEQSKLIFCKYHSEKEGRPFTPETYKKLWAEACDIYRSPDGTTFEPIAEYGDSDNRIAETINYIRPYKFMGNMQMWHQFQTAWLNKTQNKKDGQYFTPSFVKRFMVNIYRPEPTMNICDPCAGSGGFLTVAADHMLKIYPSRFYYYDIDDRTMRAAQKGMMMYEHHKCREHLIHANFCSQDSLAKDWPKMDIIYTNVPFGVRVSDKKVLAKYDTGKIGNRIKSSELSQVLFIEKCLMQLTPTGRFATVVDKGVVTNDKLIDARKHLSTMAHLDLVIELPGAAFTYCADTSFPTYLLFFSKTGSGPTYFAKVDNLGYTDKGYITSNEYNDGYNFNPEYEDSSWEKSDFVSILNLWDNKSISDSVDYDTLKGVGAWHYGAYKYTKWVGRRLSDIAVFVSEPYNGDNILTPTVDRQFKIVTTTHLDPKNKTQKLINGTIFMSRLLSEGQEPCCGIVGDDFHGCGCTDENYIIKTNNVDDTILVWYLINFDKSVQRYLHDNSKGQGRGRIKDADLMNMLIPDVSEESLNNAKSLSNKLAKKARVDRILALEISNLAS